MPESDKSLKEFEKFLASINLNLYRNTYRPIKIVKMDLDRNIQALDIIYDLYWDKKEFLDFDDFYLKYKERYIAELEQFRQKIQMCESCYYKGLPARIYRTWASLITQIQAGYLAEVVFGAGSVTMNTALDRKGIDIQVNYKSHTINYQVKKDSQSREVRQGKKIKQTDLIIEDLPYNVPPNYVFENPRKRDGEYRKPYLEFNKNKRLKRLKNGFVIFTALNFTAIKEILDQK